MTRKFLYNDNCLSFAEMATRQSKDKYAHLTSMKSEPLSLLAPDAKRWKFGEGKFEGPTPLALFQASISPTPSPEVVAVLPSSAVAPPITHSKGKSKVRKSVWEDPTTAIGRAHNVIADEELKRLFVVPSHELVSCHIRNLLQVCYLFFFWRFLGFHFAKVWDSAISLSSKSLVSPFDWLPEYWGKSGRRSI